MCAFCFRSKLTQQHRVPLERMAALALALRPGLSGVQLVRMISRYARSDEFAAELNAKMALRGVSAAELCARTTASSTRCGTSAEWAERVAAGERAFARLLDDTRLKVSEARARRPARARARGGERSTTRSTSRRSSRRSARRRLAGALARRDEEIAQLRAQLAQQKARLDANEHDAFEVRALEVKLYGAARGDGAEGRDRAPPRAAGLRSTSSARSS